MLAWNGIDRPASSKMVYVTIARNLMPYLPPAVLVVGVEPGHEKAFLGGFQAMAGRSTLQNPDEVILGQSAAEYYRPKDQTQPVAVGDAIEIQSHAFIVVGILKPAPQLFNNSVIMPLQTAQTVFDRPGAVSSVILTAASVADLPKLKAEIDARYPELTVSTQDDLQQTANVLLAGMDKFFALIMNSIVVVAIVIVTIVVVVAVMEQRKDIGTLRAVGAGRWSIFGMVAGQALVLSLLGAILALPIAVLLTRLGNVGIQRHIRRSSRSGCRLSSWPWSSGCWRPFCPPGRPCAWIRWKPCDTNKSAASLIRQKGIKPMNAMIETKNVTKTFGMNGVAVEAVRGVDLAVRRGNSSPSSAPPAAGNPACCTCSERWTSRLRARCSSGGARSRAWATAPGRICGRARSDSSSKRSIFCRC